ncbi:MAG: AraC family transcriptional regulator [Desulfobacterium sp.]|nr:AraC family transcriptional regulator [Desulfobacterium sp.]
MGIVYRTERIHGIEVLSCTEPFEFRPHIHDRYVVWLNTGGSEHYRVCGTSDILAPGSISVIEPGTVHANRPCENTHRHLRSFYIEAEFFEKICQQVGDQNAGQFHLSDKPLKDKHLWTQLAFLHGLMLGDVPELELNTQVIQVFGDFLRRHGHLKEVSRKVEVGDIRINRIIESFHDCINEPASLETLANLVGCTQYHLIRLFKEAKGMTPHAYLMQLRLENARRMLEKGATIVDSALDSGFSDQSHLTRAFRQRYGLTPGTYRKFL